ncbi:MAG: hypothetical protein A3A73_00420 [Omnitrophica bacterium RIFCSPLOWO2_01_FULL_50_24]|nr:MAG: hypothetical protein A3A73_00420 [Omnitrophica bacterium RIFCSPLOWO2_01_FULL_50_24]
MEPVALGFVFIIGAVMGSFLNVCIHRLPRGESIVWPRSQCPWCQKGIAWYDNVPLASVLWLKGKCRSCGGAISPRYAVVEWLTALAFLWMFKTHGFGIGAVVSVLLFSLLIIASVVDLEHQLIPDEISLGGLGAGLVLSALVPSLHGKVAWPDGLAQSAIGALLGGIAIYVTGVLGKLAFRKDAMGGGDVKLLAMLGAFVGWQKVILIYVAAPVLALPMGLFMKWVKREDLIPFGPFLSMAGWIAFVWGDAILAWYRTGLNF